MYSGLWRERTQLWGAPEPLEYGCIGDMLLGVRVRGHCFGNIQTVDFYRFQRGFYWLCLLRSCNGRL